MNKKIFYILTMLYCTLYYGQGGYIQPIIEQCQHGRTELKGSVVYACIKDAWLPLLTGKGANGFDTSFYERETAYRRQNYTLIPNEFGKLVMLDPNHSTSYQLGGEYNYVRKDGYNKYDGNKKMYLDEINETMMFNVVTEVNKYVKVIADRKLVKHVVDDDCRDYNRGQEVTLQDIGYNINWANYARCGLKGHRIGSCTAVGCQLFRSDGEIKQFYNVDPGTQKIIR